MIPGKAVTIVIPPHCLAAFTALTQDLYFSGVGTVLFQKLVSDMVYFIIRILWFFVVIIGVTLFGYQVTDRIIVYYQRNTNVDVEVKYVSSVEFPSVTICNQNQFRSVLNIQFHLL